MAFYPLERLEQGNVTFLLEDRLTSNDIKEIINDIRKSPRRKLIIDGCIDKLKEYENFIIEVIYDMDEYKNISIPILDKIKNKFLDNMSHVFNLLNTFYGKEYIFDNLNILENKDETIVLIIKYILSDYEENKEFINKIINNNNLHVRYLFMNSLIKYFPSRIKIFDDITTYLSNGEELMSKDDISSLAYLSFRELTNRNIWLKLKDFILSNYDKNELGLLLLDTNNVDKKNIYEFKTDSDKYFETSAKGKLYIYKNYKKYLSNNTILKFEKYINIFNVEGKIDIRLYRIFEFELSSYLESFIDKYLDLSKTKECKYISSGSTASTYQIGDYVIKIINSKWNNNLCPNNYLIIKNLEEIYVRDNNNKIIAGIEVQPFLSKKVKEEDIIYIEMFKNELEKLGYYSSDTFINGTYGDNCMVLDSYYDADTKNYDELPLWFKTHPIVLVDRDCIYKTDNYCKTLKKK